MTPRPRKATDEEVFGAAYRVMARLGPTELTLADIAAEAGLTPGALLARYGSKRELLLTLTARLAEAMPGMLTELRAAHASPLGAVRAYAEHFGGMARTPRELAHHLGWLQLDVGDPAFLRHLRAQSRATLAALTGWIEEAVAAGELIPDVDPVELAEAVCTTVSGSLMTWAFFSEGSAAEWMRRNLDLLLRHYTPGAGARSGRRRGARLGRSTSRTRPGRKGGGPRGRSG